MKTIKNSKKRFSRTIVLIIILIFSFLLTNYEQKNAKNTPLFVSALIPHSAIYIDSDIGLEIFPGTGIAEDPYLIEEYNITTTSSSGIEISGTTKHFRISNCYINASTYGIYIYNIADGTATVNNNTCSDNGYVGIALSSSASSTITNNTCSNNSEGIYLSSSASSTIANNTCNNNNLGIDIYYSASSTIANNTCNNNLIGIWLGYSGSSTVANNTCNNNNNSGIDFYFSESSTVANNTFSNCGLEIIEDTLDAYISYTLEDNWVNGKILGFCANLDSTIISEQVYGQLILINCTNVTVRDQILNYTTTGLSLYYCTSSVIINNTCSNNRWGIWLQDSGGSTVTNNTCTNNYWCGISLYESSGSSTVVNNICSNNYGYGIYLYSSISSTVTNNTCTNNDWEGIWLVSSGSSTIAKNTCNKNMNGIWISVSSGATLVNNTCTDNSYDGIYLDDSFGSTLTNNTCNSNQRFGTILNSSDSCLIIYNNFQETGEYGIYVESSSNNIFHHNNFIDNNLGGTSQAYDDGTNNVWYDTSMNEGNYWSDWSGIGSYLIDAEHFVDPYPLDEEVKPPVISEFAYQKAITIPIILCLLLVPFLFKKRRKNA